MKLGRYEIVRELGKGAMGIVYLAKDPLIGRLVALKTIRPAAHADDDETKEFQQRFIREAQAAGILNHPSIVTVHDIGQDEATGMSFIAMEYVEGLNLKEALATGRNLTFEQIGDIIAQVAEGLDFAHAKGIVHRDVKPANIILLDGMRAKITDFGIAKITSGGNLTTTGQFLGTPNYMAPEQIKGAPVDGRTDLFSLGICLYECLTRRKPFGGDSLTTISYRIVHEPFPPLGEINPQIPAGFEDVVAMCLQKDPARRYQRGRDMAVALRSVLRGEKPAKPEPMLAEETVITRDREKIPTVEVPFPQAAPPTVAVPAPVPANRATVAVPMPVVAPTSPGTPPPPPRPKTTIKPLAQDLMRKTFAGVQKVKDYAFLKRKIPLTLFLPIVGATALLLLIPILLIQMKQPKPRPVDRSAELRQAQKTKLEKEANDLLRAGRVDDAYLRYVQLNKMAPGSPAYSSMLQKLGQVRAAEALSKQQIADAKAKFDQAQILFNEKKYADALPLLEDSFHINPSSDETANLLKSVQLELQKAEEAKLKSRQATTKVAQNQRNPRVDPRVPVTTTVEPVPVNLPPAHLTTYFNSTVNDGYIMVKADGQVVAHENLWQENGRLFRRKQPRLVNVTHDVPGGKPTEIELWVVIQSMGVQEHRVFRETFQAGSNARLTVTFDPQSKKFDYSFN